MQRRDKATGKDRKGQQRYRCLSCKRTFFEAQTKRVEGMRLPLNKAVLVAQLLVEGNSVRSTSRITGVEKKTILSLLVLLGERCERLMVDRIKDLAVSDVQCDEIWNFIGMKQKAKNAKGIDDPMVGDAYTFVGLERNTKLVLAWHLGQRTEADTIAFTEKLAHATRGAFQVTTDGFKPYQHAVVMSLGARHIDFAQLVKMYANNPEGQTRYSPAECTGCKKIPIYGNPDMRKVSTSHIERQNLNIRMANRRFTRLTNGFSKKWENLKANLAIYFAYYNFCRVHSSLRVTPAMEGNHGSHLDVAGATGSVIAMAKVVFPPKHRSSLLLYESPSGLLDGDRSYPAPCRSALALTTHPSWLSL